MPSNSPSGVGVLITVEELPGNVTENDMPTIKISVEDTGIGISPEAQEKLFEKFSQADSSTTAQIWRYRAGAGNLQRTCRHDEWRSRP